MVSLQIVTPHMECMFNCPFCIAKAHTHQNQFINKYLEDYDLWKGNLINTIHSNPDLKYVVITGTNEPMQSKDCVSDIANIIRGQNRDIQVEIQTRYYKPDDVYDSLDVVAYSISDPRLIKGIKPKGNISRYVFILTNLFNGYKLEDILKIVPEEVSQMTFKVLQDSAGENPVFDEIIKQQQVDRKTLSLLRDDISSYKDYRSIRLDENCMDSEGRYQIFREDGQLYPSWDSCEPIKQKQR